MRVVNNPTYMEPKPQKWHSIYCFDCKVSIPTKAQAAAKHQGHNVDYLDADGKRMA